MRIRVLFFGVLKEICGKTEGELDVPSGATVGSVFEHFAQLYPRLRGMASSIVMARNHEFAAATEAVSDDDEIALLPPVSGGSLPPPSRTGTSSSGRLLPEPILDLQGHYFALTRDPIDVRKLENDILQGIDGALVTFHGVVRNNTKGRATLRLEYECYPEMAVRTMASIGREIAQSFAISRILMVHRLGMLEIGEASVVVIAAAPHRRPAFEAALEGINRLKRLVPVWKKEYFADGEVWVEGEWDEAAPRAGS